MKTLNNAKGFTLIELGIVMVIIAALAATAIPKITGMSGDAKAQSMAGVATAIEKSNDSLYATASRDMKSDSADKLVFLGDKELKTVFGYAAANVFNIVQLAGVGEFADEAAMDASTTVANSGTLPEGGTVSKFHIEKSDDLNVYVTMKNDDNHTALTGSKCYISYTESAMKDMKPFVAFVNIDC
jgi:prepilin-type N-terminal cleavage/methylation domain-containing protein